MNKISSFCVLLFLNFASPAFSGSASEWQSRSIYQILTDRFARTDGSQNPCSDLSNYCGGTFVGIKNKLDYIASMGFDAIWISPVVTNYDKGYHGYWATNIYSINSNFGTAAELKALISAAHSKGIWVMVDVVGNHVGPVGLDFSQIIPFNNPSYYHSRCQIVNWNNQTEVEYCRLADLPDLDQSNLYVKNALLNWIQNLVAEYGFDGIRIDTIPEVSGSFWAQFAKSAGVFQIGEALSSDYSYVGGYQNYIDAVLNYNLYYQIRSQFGSKASMYNFRTHYQNMDKYFKNQDVLGNFVDNHDNSRFLYTLNDQRLFKSALAFALASKGIPITYYGSEQAFNGGNDTQNREVLWTSRYSTGNLINYLTVINKARKIAAWYNQVQIERYVDDYFYAFSRGTTFFAFTNQPDNQQVRTITYHPYSEGQKICNIFYPTTDCITVQNKMFTFYLLNGEVKIYVPSTTISAVTA